MRGVRAALLAQAAALAAAPAALLLAAGLPLAAAGRLSPRAFATLVGVATLATFLVALALLFRAVGRPLARLLAVAGRIRSSDLPLLGPPEDERSGGLSRAAVAFERAAAALEADRARLREQVVELESSGRALATAQERLGRSERLASVGLLAAGVAHEIGNPLGAISGYAELARARLSAGGTAEVADFLERIVADARRIDGIVRDLLDLSRPEPVALGPVSLAEVVEEALGTARAQPRFAGVAVTVALPPDLPPVLADARRLSQVLLNVFLNAGDAMEGSGALRIEAARTAAAVEVRVTDEGPGIPPQHLSRVFDPFFTTKPPGQGTGLGLAVSHAAMEAFGGAIAAEPAPGGGATFRLTLRPAGAPEAAW
jgi:signal transduction histidine kinase